MLSILGEVDYVIFQHGGVRAVHGWLDMEGGGRVFYFPSPAATYVFKVIYDFPRPDAQADNAHARGFLAEIVYGVDQFVSDLSLPPELEHGHGFVLADDNAVVGLVRCSPSASLALAME